MTATEAPPKRRLGQILVDLGVLEDADIEHALAAQGSSGRRLGEILLEKGLVTRRNLVEALAVQFGLEFMDLDEQTIDTELATRVSLQMARRHRALPIMRRGDRIIVAMANAADVLALDDIRIAVGGQVTAVLAEAAQIQAAIDDLEHSDSRVQEAIQAAVGASSPDVARKVEVRSTETPNDSPIVQFVDLLLAKAIQEGASDIHIEPLADDLRIRFRVDGLLREAMMSPKSLEAGVVSRLKVMADIDIAERRVPQDGRMSVTIADLDVDFRVVTLPTVYGESVVLRLLPSGVHGTGLTELGFLPEQLAMFEKAYRQPWGAVLVTGPTGSGKSTTLHGTIDELKDATRNILTIEDPVEHRVEGIKQVQVNTRAGLTFANALRSFLRADPDVILVGEIRDSETATIAIEASLTGHLVLSTLHTNNAASTPMRLIEMGVEPFLVTSSLNAVVAQRLARRLCERCKQPREVEASSPEAAYFADLVDSSQTFEIWEPGGCKLCGETGYRGRMAVHEVMLMTPRLADLLLRRADADEIERTAIDEGMITLRSDGLRKVLAGDTSLAEVFRITT